MSFEDREIVVKNDDANITYFGEWTTVQSSAVNRFGNFGPALSATLHSTKTIGSFSFPFHGSSINVIGSINIANSSTDPNPSWNCNLDGIDFVAPNIFQFPENNWSLCSQGNIPDGAHELVINVASNGMPFYLDYIKYRPSANASLENALIWIENVDPAVDYISGWTSLGETANQTTDPKGLVNVTFVGIQLSWYGFVPTERPHNASSGEYSIDGQPFSSFQLPGLPPSNIVTTYNQLFFTTPNLEMGTHMLSVKYTGSPGQTPFTLDYLTVSNGSLPSSSSSPGRSTAPTPTNGGGDTPTPTLPNGGGNTSVPTNGNSETSLNVGAIVGGVVGGIGSLVICSIILSIWLIYRRRLRVDERDYDHTRRSLNEPFSHSASPMTARRESINGGISTTIPLTADTHRHHPSQPIISQTRSPSMLNVFFPRDLTSNNTRPVQMIPPIPPEGFVNVLRTEASGHIQYEDSGFRLFQLTGIVETPPSYSEQ